MKKHPKTRFAAALRLNRLGYAILPVKSHDKSPAAGASYKSATKKRSKVVKHWRKNPTHNIGIATGAKSGFFALDIDVKNGKNGEISLSSLELEFGKLPRTVTVLTPSGGKHYYFRTDGRVIKNRLFPSLSGIDVRGDGGYVLAAGSKLPAGKYCYAEGLSPNALEIADAPEWLLEKVTEKAVIIPEPEAEPQDAAEEVLKKYGASALRSELAGLLATAEGDRNNALNIAAFSLGQLIAAGVLQENEVRAKLLEASHSIGLDEAEAAKTIESGFIAGKKNPRALPVLKPQSNRSSESSSFLHEIAKQTMGLQKTDIGNAERLLLLFPDKLLYCNQLGWLIYDGKHFQKDSNSQSLLLAQSVPDLIRAEAELITDTEEKKKHLAWAKSSAKAANVAGMLKMAMPKVAVPFTAFDADAMLLNVANGTLDLRTGELRPHSHKDLITSVLDVAYDPKAKCPTFKRFLGEIFQQNKKMIGFIQRAVGNSLTGDGKEQVLYYCYGVGRNGKSTFVNTIRDMLGSYGCNVATETLMVKKHGNEIRNDLARLYGARMVTALETNHGRKLDESLIKCMTGGDKLVVRFLYKEHFEFPPQFKLWFSANYYLQLTSSDDAIWRRILLVPFAVVIPAENVDEDLPKKLKSEHPGILAWAVRGVLKWQKRGLNPPEEVVYAGTQYRSNTDHVKKYIHEGCIIEKDAKVSKADLFNWYVRWCDKNEIPPHSKNAFGKAISTLEYREYRKGSQRYWKGLRIKY